MTREANFLGSDDSAKQVFSYMSFWPPPAPSALSPALRDMADSVIEARLPDEAEAAIEDFLWSQHTLSRPGSEAAAPAEKQKTLHTFIPTLIDAFGAAVAEKAHDLQPIIDEFEATLQTARKLQDSLPAKRSQAREDRPASARPMAETLQGLLALPPTFSKPMLGLVRTAILVCVVTRAGERPGAIQANVATWLVDEFRRNLDATRPLLAATRGGFFGLLAYIAAGMLEKLRYDQALKNFWERRRTLSSDYDDDPAGA